MRRKEKNCDEVPEPPQTPWKYHMLLVGEMVGIQVWGKVGLLGWHSNSNYTYLKIRTSTRGNR